MKTRLVTYLLLIVPFLLTSCARKEPTLTFMVGGAPDEIAYWEQLIGNFEHTTGIEVQLLRQPTDSDLRRQELVVPLKAKQHSPDVFLMDVIWIGQFAASGWLEPLDTYIANSNYPLDPFFSKVLDYADKYRDNLVALPIYVDGGLLYYRKDLLADYGYRNPPDRWQDLVKISIRIQNHQRPKHPNFYGFVWQGAQYEGLVCTFLEFAASNGGGITDQHGTIRLPTSENIEALKFMSDLIHQHQISPPNTFTEMKEEEVRRFFQQGNALFERNWPYAWSLHQKPDSPVKNKVGIAPLPHFDPGTSVSTLGGWHIGISKYSDAKHQAWQLVQYITSFETTKQLVLNLGWNPGRKDVYHDQDVIDKFPHLPILKGILQQVTVRPKLPYYTQVSQVLQTYLNQCLSGTIDPEQALVKAQDDIDKITAMYEIN
jgi:multiple sugar transport system substrate-binding protein